MKHILVGFVFAFTITAQSNPGAGSIEGHVLNLLTSAPVRKAKVMLTTPQIVLIADTDAEGTFQFTGLPPGTYRLSARHSGFVDRASRRPISLGPNDLVANAEIRLRPQGVITGHILDEDGEPVSDAYVSGFKEVYRDGRKRWERLNSGGRTNDTGEYRFPSLTPGRYLLQAVDPRQQVNNRYGDSPKRFYVPTFYPNAPSEQAASPVEVGVGGEIRGIDIHLLRIALPPSAQVSGKVTGVQPDSPTVVLVSLHSVDGGFFSGSTVANPPDYAFALSAPLGQYTIRANVYSGGPEAYGTGSLTVAGNVSGVVLAMSRAPEITGRISLAEEGSQVNLRGVTITLNDLLFHASVQELRPEPTGKIVFPKPIRPGHYALTIRSMPDGCFVQKVKLGGQEVSADDFEILNSAQLDIVLSKTAGKIIGSVVDDDGKLFPISSVTLIPSDGKGRPVKQSADDDGKFQFTALRPGKYKLFAWEEVDDDLWEDPEFRRKYESRAAEISVGPGEAKTAQIHVIEAAEMN